MSAAHDNLTARLRDSVIVECGEAADRIEALEAQISARAQPEQTADQVAAVMNDVITHGIGIMRIAPKDFLADPAPHDAQSVLPPLPKPADTALIQGPQGGEYRSLSDNYEPDCAMFSPNQMRAYGQLCRTSDRDAPFNPDWANYRQGLADGSDRDAVAMLRREIHNLRRQIEDYGRDAAQGEIVGGDSNHNTVILAIDGTVPRSLWTIGNRAAIRALKGEGK